MTYAKQQGKPVLLDFTGWSCVNCRQMEERVWPNPKVMKFIREEYILISLYVDDKTPLEKPYTSSVTGKEIKTIGKKWSEMQVAKYNNQSQPWYVLIDHEEKLLNQPRGNTPNADTFAEYLKCGLTTYKTRSKQKN
jgi:thiol:disulfide interchange protein DsbD